jgi:hypothetical protein
MQPGAYLVTWWVPVRNSRGSVVLDPRSLRFATEQDARIAGATLAHARYSEITTPDRRRIRVAAT